MAAFNTLLSTLLQRRGRINRHGIVVATNGSGKTQAFGSLLSRVLLFSDAKATVEEAQGQRSAADLAWRLLSSAEKDTRLPSITTPVCGSTTIWGSGPVTAPDELTEASEVAEFCWLVAVDLLTRHMASGCYELGSLPPPRESSPCGVIRLSTPRIPRAPGRPVDLPVPSHMRALAA
ncbi:hypothetical protein [Streptomyces sp. NPDC001642]|uniref:hypothetical protein n=1 Tax=Streptomyces sp. NPDC001642 TaxID=3154392 RepID=UPI00332CAA8C